MSAITGIRHFNQAHVSTEYGQRLMQGLQKYPADDVRTWDDQDIFLGCHSQWITPESVGERNPYYDSARGLVVAADAIIDNRDELFQLLQIEANRQKSMTDSELIVLAYSKWGEDAPKYLIGDFAFMIWDERNQLLFGARDFSGSRTLYYHCDKEAFAFCTVIQPLLSLPHVNKSINEHWIAEYLANPGVIECVDDTSTVFRDIQQLPPSHAISIKGERVTVSRYCKITQQEERLKLKSDQEYEEAFLDVFQQAIQSRLRTHRQVGAFLSGGLDSGTIVSLAARELHKKNSKLHTYSYIPVDDYIDWTPKSEVADERPYIHSTVNHVGNINDNYLDFKGKSALTEVDDWLEMLEMPYKIFENSYWINGIYEKAQNQGVGVLLSGARGNNTISWGPALSHYASLLKEMKWIRLFREMEMYSANNGVKRSRFMKAVAQKAYPFMKRGNGQQVEYHFPKLIHPDLAARTDVYSKLQAYDIDSNGFTSPSNIFETRKKHFEQTFVWSLNGTCGTKSSLRYAVWNRDPSNDLRVIKFCLSVPENQTVKDGMDRALIRRSTKGLLPDKVRLNQRVRGVQGADGIHRMVPDWHSFIEELQKLADDPQISSYINIPVVKEAIARIEGTTRPNNPFDADYSILMRSLIMYRFLQKNA